MLPSSSDVNDRWRYGRYLLSYLAPQLQNIRKYTKLIVVRFQRLHILGDPHSDQHNKARICLFKISLENKISPVHTKFDTRSLDPNHKMVHCCRIFCYYDLRCIGSAWRNMYANYESCKPPLLHRFAKVCWFNPDLRFCVLYNSVDEKDKQDNIWENFPFCFTNTDDLDLFKQYILSSHSYSWKVWYKWNSAQSRTLLISIFGTFLLAFEFVRTFNNW